MEILKIVNQFVFIVLCDICSVIIASFSERIRFGKLRMGREIIQRDLKTHYVLVSSTQLSS